MSYLGDADGQYTPILPTYSDNVLASGLNDHGEIVGILFDNQRNFPVGFYYRPWAGFQDFDLRAELGIPLSNTQAWTYPRQINNNGEVIGLQVGYGSFYQDWLGRVKSWKVQSEFNSSSANPVFSDINDNGTAIGTYTGLDGSFRLFTYQSELTGEG